MTKSTPFGSQDHPFNPIALALGADASFVARTVDTDRDHETEVLRAAAAHRGSSFVEIYQNCNVFNDGAFDAVRGKAKAANQIRLVDGEPIRFGAEESAAWSAAGTGACRWPTSPRSARTPWSSTTLTTRPTPTPSPASPTVPAARLPLGVLRSSDRPDLRGGDGRGARRGPGGRRRRRPDRAAPLGRHLDHRVAVGATDPDGQAQQLDQPPERRTLGAKGGNGRRVPLWTRRRSPPGSLPAPAIA